jgi:hypothetical protein
MTLDEHTLIISQLKREHGSSYVEVCCEGCGHRLGHHSRNYCIKDARYDSTLETLPCKCNGFELDTFERLVRNIRND